MVFLDLKSQLNFIPVKSDFLDRFWSDFSLTPHVIETINAISLYPFHSIIQWELLGRRFAYVGSPFEDGGRSCTSLLSRSCPMNE